MTTNSSQIYIVRDDGGGQNMVLGGGEWSSTTSGTFFSGGAVWPNFAIEDRQLTGFVSVSFLGTSLAFWGTSCPDASLQGFQVSIDGALPYSTSTTDEAPQNYMQWFQSPLLPEGQHNLTALGLRGQALDFMLISPGQSTPLSGETLMIDDAYPDIQYRGSGWQDRQEIKFKQDDFLGVRPFQNGTHSTSNTGDSLSFAFTGTSLRLFGILPARPGSISLTHMVDAGAAIQSTHNFTGVEGASDLWNFQLLDTGILSAGDHNITVILNNVVNQALIVDYILYTPSFATLSEMRNLTTGGAPPTSSQSPSVSATTVSTTVEVSPSATSAEGPSRIKLGAVAGGAVGGVLGLCLLAMLIICIRHRRRRPISVQGWSPVNDTSIVTPYKFESFPPNAGWNRMSDTDTLVAAPPPALSGYNVGVGKRSHARNDSDTLPRISPPQMSNLPLGLCPPPPVSFPSVPLPPAMPSTPSVAMRRADIEQRIQDLERFIQTAEVYGSLGTETSFSLSYLSDQASSISTETSKPLPPVPNDVYDIEEWKKEIEKLKEQLVNRRSTLQEEIDLRRSTGTSSSSLMSPQLAYLS